MGENICFIIGNGFNHLIKEICRNKVEYYKDNKIPHHLDRKLGEERPIGIKIRKVDNKKELNNFLINFEKLINLWDEPERPFSDLVYNLNLLLKDHNLTTEQIIGIINKTSEFIENKLSNESSVKNFHVKDLSLKINSILIYDALKNCSDRFQDYENNGNYTILRELFRDEKGYFGKCFDELIKNENIHIYSTNYDGIIHSILSYYVETKSTLNYFGADGFINGDFQTWVLQRNRNLLLLLHGSYRFMLNEESNINKPTTYGYDLSEKNHPIMVYNDPCLKMDVIRNYYVLNYYFEIFKESLQNCSKLIIFGNSLKSDPHIVKAISNNFDKEKELIIVDYDEDCCKSVENILKEHCQFKIKFEQTKEIHTTEELLNLFEELIKN
ncbi:hypothetical protein [Methanococcus maripaludis]|uniref:SIR2-like domain-containing protein n=1 Tax=Methanococcus maripaludis TaxID=39152 RepID=A0A8T3W006_METMI|nr:hypothetical protein [Methanococcus maripaludis]MBG0769531.1 hypothetical protein [Methanococcus maripaludis]